jgi:DNA-binding NtrC family response regulator
MEKYKVLLIEDDDTSREQLVKAIRKEGYEVLAAENGGAGLEVFKKELPEIVITDLKMAGVDGLEVMHTVRRLSRGVQVILITAYGETDTAVSALREGALDYLKKPLDLDLLTTALGRARERIIEHKKSIPFPTVLLAEDDGPIRERIARVLEKEGWKVFAVADGEEAINVFGQRKIDIVLLDIKMPKKDGLQALHEMRGISDDFEAIVFTGYGDEASAIQALRDGAVNFLKKPVDLEELVLAVEKGLEKLHTERSLKYRTRELELSKQIVAKITGEKEIVVDVRDNTRKPARDFAQRILDAMPVGLAILDRDMKIPYVNAQLARAIEYQPEKTDEQFVQSLTKMGIKGLSYESLMSTVNKVFESPKGTLEIMSVGKYAYLMLTTITILREEKEEEVVLIGIRGARK